MMQKRKLPKNDRLCVRLVGGKDQSGHHERSRQFDLRNLRDGRKGERGYSGRPGLSTQIVSESVLRKLSAGKRQNAAVWLWAISHFWRSLDAYEASHPGERIDDVVQLVGAVWENFQVFMDAESRTRIAFVVYKYCRDAVQAVLQEKKIGVELPSNPFGPRLKGRARRRITQSPYDADTELKVAEALRAHRHAVLDRIARANALADRGADPAETLAKSAGKQGKEFRLLWTPENTARFVRDEVLQRFPDWNGFRQLYGFESRRIPMPPAAEPVKLPQNSKDDVVLYTKAFGNGAGLGASYRNFLPTYHDLATWPVEMIHAAGLNGQPAMDFDRGDWYERIGPDAVMMFTSKTRSGGKAIEFRSATGPDSAFGILSSALGITKRPHDWVVRELDGLNSLPPSKRSARVEERIDELEQFRERVWLCLRLIPLGVTALTTGWSALWHTTNMILQKRGVLEAGRPFEWSGRRTRDSFAYDVWLSKRCLPTVKSSLHHDDGTRTENYLDHPISRDEEAVTLVQIVQHVRADLVYVARTGRRAGPEGSDGPEATAAAAALATMTMFGPARAWLEAEAPTEILRLLSDSLLPEPE